MREIDDHDELRALCADDSLCLWAARGLDGRSRAWADAGAVVVQAPDLFLRDRLIVHGAAAVPLVRKVLAVVGTSHQVMGAPEVVDALVDAEPSWAPFLDLGWMESTALAREPEPGSAHWLTEADWPEVRDFLAEEAPGSFVRPGVSGPQRWAGIRDGGALRSVAGLGWSAPAVGVIAGVATSRDRRGQGLGRRICEFVIAEALREHGVAALFVHRTNPGARALYERLGMRYRAVRTAACQVSDAA